MPAHVAERVVEDGKQPRLEVRPWFELMGRAKRLQIRVLHQVLSVRRAARQAHRGPKETVDVGQRGLLEIRVNSARPARRGSTGRTAYATAEGHARTAADAQRREHRGRAGLFLHCIAERTPPFPVGDNQGASGPGNLPAGTRTEGTWLAARHGRGPRAGTPALRQTS